MKPEDVLTQLGSKLKETATSAVVQVPPQPPEKTMMADAGTIASGIGVVGGGLISAILWLRRKLPKDTLEIGKDRTEGQLMQTLREERDAAVKRADAAMQQSVTDAGQIAGLVERNKYLQEEVTRLNTLVVKMEKQFDDLKESIRNLTVESRKPIPTQATGNKPPNTTL